MKIRLIIGLLLTLTFAQSVLADSDSGGAAAADDDDQEELNYNDDADYEISDTSDPSSISNINLSTTTASTTTSTKTIGQIIFNSLELDEGDNENDRLKYACTSPCNCSDDTRFIDCSHQNLTSVPKNLPKNAYKIDLSYNLIENLEINDFVNCSELREIILTSNLIAQIDKEVFANLEHLDHIGLSSNRFTNIDPDTFSEAVQLKKLCLNRNPIVIPEDGPLLNLPELEELNLSKCNISELNSHTFSNLVELQSLDLSENLLEDYIDAEIFNHLKNLRKFKMTNLAESSVLDLCDVLISIDLINFDKFDVSCLEFVAGSTYEESIVAATLKPLTVNPLTKDQDLDPPDITPIIPTNKTIIEKKNVASVNDNESEENLELVTSDLTNEKPNGQRNLLTESVTMRQNGSVNGTPSSSTAIPTTMRMDDVAKDKAVHVSNQTINNILLGIIAVTVSGLIIGIICRRDCFGIKTKMCRTRRPPPTDQVRPAEEVPLNKISV